MFSLKIHHNKVPVPSIENKWALVLHGFWF
jgi:hypothetical protein